MQVLLYLKMVCVFFNSLYRLLLKEMLVWIHISEKKPTGELAEPGGGGERTVHLCKLELASFPFEGARGLTFGFLSICYFGQMPTTS